MLRAVEVPNLLSLFMISVENVSPQQCPKIQLPLKVPNIEFNFNVSFSTLMYP